MTVTSLPLRDERPPVAPPVIVEPLSVALETAHHAGVGAAANGLRDAALGALRLTGPGVPVLAEAAVSSATPYLRSPLLARMSAALLLHPPVGDADGVCTTCGTLAPCATTRLLLW